MSSHVNNPTLRAPSDRIVVCGAGIMGASTAYYLAMKGFKPTVIDACTPACSASGKAGGFLALDWNDGTPLEQLARTSYKLHEELAESLGSNCGYRKMNTFSARIEDCRSGGGIGGKGKGAGFKDSMFPGWVDRHRVTPLSRLGTKETTAQVHPKLLTDALLRHVVELGGCVISHAKAEKLHTDSSLKVTGIQVARLGQNDTVILEADAVVFALGAWTDSLASILPSIDGASVEIPSIRGLKVHSVVVDDPHGLSDATALFLRDGSSNGAVEPEMYPRPDNTIYVCGVESHIPPPELASDVLPDPDAIPLLKGVMTRVVPSVEGVLHAQACYLPCSTVDHPIISDIPGIADAYIVAGHSCWGILNGPASGLALAELIVEGASKSVDLDPFRLRPGNRRLRSYRK